MKVIVLGGLNHQPGSRRVVAHLAGERNIWLRRCAAAATFAGPLPGAGWKADTSACLFPSSVGKAGRQLTQADDVHALVPLPSVMQLWSRDPTESSLGQGTRRAVEGVVLVQVVL